MLDRLHPSVFHRIRFTPMRDVVRGRLSGRLDWRNRVDASDLPAPAKDLVKRVVKRTRLWSLERVDVADELLSHFADGLESGASLEQLIESFGDERGAARLIRRAKKRNRAFLWHIFRGLAWVLVGLIAFYACLAIYFFTGTPAPKINYVTVLNRKLEHVPDSDRAWLLYRQAVLELRSRSPEERKETDELTSSFPESSDMPRLARWLHNNRSVVELVRQGAEKPTLGWVLGPAGAADDPILWPSRGQSSSNASQDESLVSVLLPHLNELSTLSGVLKADARLARHEGDAQRLMRDLTAMINMARQMQFDFSIVVGLVAAGIRDRAFNEIERELIQRPELLSSSDLQTLAHLLTRPDSAAEMFNLEGERLMFHDAVQRMYTDNGAGDGRMTLEGLRFLNFAATVNGVQVEPVQAAALPPLAIVCASRREVIEQFDRLIDQAKANFSQPLRDANWDTLWSEVEKWNASLISKLKFAPLRSFVPALTSLQTTAERYLARRDGIVVAIALELHRREHGSYPESLDRLVPALLPRIPSDRVTGEPIRYRLIDGRPVIYSVGIDRDDDGGRSAKNNFGVAEPYGAAPSYRSDAKIPNGDWILYPTQQAN